MKTEYQKAREYLYDMFSKAKPEQREKSYWTYMHYVVCMRRNYEQTNTKLLESLIIKHNEDLRKY